MPIRLEIVTPEKRAYDDDVDAVVLPGSEGELGILPHHAPLLSMLGAGELRVRKGGTRFMDVAGKAQGGGQKAKMPLEQMSEEA